MIQYKVIFTPEAREHMYALYRYIAMSGSPETGKQYIKAIAEFCKTLQNFPYRGTCRDDLSPGLRITHYRKRTAIAYAIEANQVFILGIFYGGQNYETALQKLDLDD